MAMKGFMEKKIDCSYEEYKEKRKEVEEKFACRPIYLPKNEDMEKKMVKIFSKSNHWLHNPIIRYKNTNKEISEYTFDRASVAIIDEGDEYVTMLHDKRVARNFRRVVVKNLMQLENVVERQIEKQGDDIDTLLKLSRQYRNFCESDSKMFGYYVKEDD